MEQACDGIVLQRAFEMERVTAKYLSKLTDAML